MLNDVDGINNLVENIARKTYGAEWKMAVRSILITTPDPELPNSREVMVRVASRVDLDLLEETVVSAFDFGVRSNHSSSVAGSVYADWEITRSWWFDVTDADRGDINSYPGAVPKGTVLCFMYSEARTAPKPV